MNNSQLWIIGHVGRDAEMRYTPAGQAVTNFSVAESREYTQGDEKRKYTVWYKISVWGKMAEVCNQYVKKGMQVFVTGTIEPDKATGNPRLWSTSDGKPASSFEITASSVKFLSRPDVMANTAQELANGTEEEIPF